jgi:5'(3')-deoxyribonucleotidase
VYYRERIDLVWKALKVQSRPIYHLIDDVFPFVPENDVFLAVSELFVHLEILINEGRAELADSGPSTLYRAL